jgi:hypothetical protein
MLTRSSLPSSVSLLLLVPALALSEKREEPKILPSRLVTLTLGAGNQKPNGFIARMDGQTYLVTTQRNLFGSQRISFGTLSGEPLHPRGVELSVSRGLARLPLAEEVPSLGLSDQAPMNAEVWFPHCRTKGIPMKTSKGNIVGVGADTLEISAPFVPEESGAPLLNAEGKAIGVLGYVQKPYLDELKKGTRFGYTPRYFCHRIANTRWRPVAWKKYNARFGGFYRESTAFAECVESIISILDENPTQTIPHAKKAETILVSWIQSHNRLADKQRKTTKTRLLAIDISENIKQLARICRDRSQKLQLFSEQRGLTRFLSDDFAAMANELDSDAQILDILGNNARDYR